MEILEAFDLTGTLRGAAQLAGCDHKTVAHWVRARDEAGGGLPVASRPRPRVDAFAVKIDEWVDRSRGRIRADVCHQRLVAMGYMGSERTTRRAVAEAKRRWRAEHGRRTRPWVVEPGLWMQWDYGDGPVVEGRSTVLFCAWLAWSRYRVVLALRDRSMASIVMALDRALRAFGGAPTYALTDNEKTVSVDHVCGIAVRNPTIVAVGRHYGLTIATCVPADPESKGGSEATVRIAKADLVPTDHNLRDAYGSFAELEQACADFCERVNAREHRITRRPPAVMLAEERDRLHRLPAIAHTSASVRRARSRGSRRSRLAARSTRSRRRSSTNACGCEPTVASSSSFTPTSPKRCWTRSIAALGRRGAERRKTARRAASPSLPGRRRVGVLVRIVSPAAIWSIAAQDPAPEHSGAVRLRAATTDADAHRSG
jgi:transposase